MKAIDMLKLESGKTVHILCSLVLLFLAFPFRSFALSETYGGYYCTVNPGYDEWADLIWHYTIKDGGAVITNVSTTLDTEHWLYRSHAPEQIPARLGGVPVTEIGDTAFWCCYGADAINIPDTVKSIGYGAFYYAGGDGNGNIQELVIPNSVESIGAQAFRLAGWYTMKSITIGDGVRSIGSDAFSGCAAVSEIHMGTSLTNCASDAFYGVHGDITNILGYHLVHSDELEVHVKDIATWCKIDFTNATPYNSYNTLICQGKANGVKLIAGGEEVIDLVVPEGVSKIGSLSFAGYTNLLSATFPASLNTVGAYAFNGCTNITRVYISDIASWCATGDPVPCQHELFLNGEKLSHVTVPSGVPSIRGLNKLTGVKSIWVQEGCDNIDYSAFRGAPDLEEVIVEEGVTNVADSAFESCPNLKKVVLPSSVAQLGRYCFFDLPQLESICIHGLPPAYYHYNYPSIDWVASDAILYYDIKFEREWKENGGSYIDQDGSFRWLGLRMMPYKDESIYLKVDGANPAEGSLTLAWEDAGAVEGVTYSVYRSANDTYSAADLVADSLTETTWTDTNYWAAEPVLKPLNYWVVADGGGYGERVSEPVETRRRFGVFVGLSDYDPKIKEDRIASPVYDATKLQELFVDRGEMASSRAKVISNSGASWDDVERELRTKVSETQPGDLFVLYIATHGKYENGTAELLFYDDWHGMNKILGVLSDFNPGTIVIPVFMACHSGAFVDYASGTPDKSPTEKVLDELSEGFKLFVNSGLAMCRANMPVLASCGAEEKSSDLGPYSDFGEAFIHQGWGNGYADGKLQGVGYAGVEGDGYVSFLELIRYAQAFARGHSDTLRSHVKWTEEHEQLLRSTLAGRAGTGGQNVPSAPEKIEATEGVFDLKIVVSWSGVPNTTRYWLYVLKDGRTGDDEEDWECLSYRAKSTARWHKGALLGKSYLYRVRAVNGAGASGFSPVARGSRGTGTFIDWVKEKGVQLGLSMALELLAAMPSANGVSLEGCYISGIDPLDSHAAFEAELLREDGKWKAKPKGGEKEGRVYRVEGKKKMSDEDWTDVTDVEDLDAEGWRFFRVGVELAE